MNFLKFWSQKVIPLVYDNSLSYYEFNCKVCDYLNKVIEQLNTFASYFNNLNVQDEINNKIDDMADNGELEAIITPIVGDYSNPIFVDAISNEYAPRVLVLKTSRVIWYWNGSEYVNSGLSYGVAGFNFQYTGAGITLASNLDMITDNTIRIGLPAGTLNSSYPSGFPTDSAYTFYSYNDGTTIFQKLMTLDGEWWRFTPVSVGAFLPDSWERRDTNAVR